MNDWEEAAHIRAMIREGKLPGSCINEDGTLGIDRDYLEAYVHDPFFIECELEVAKKHAIPK